MNTLFDAQAALGFVTAQTTHVEREVNEARYPDIQYAALIPVDTSAHPFAQSVTYYSSDAAGKAGWINGNADDVPNVDTDRTAHNTSIQTAAIGYGYGWEEVGQAMMLGIPLTADKARSARRISEEFVDNLALRGDAAKGFKGLINSSDITPVSAVTGGWGTATPDQILADVNAALYKVTVDTNTVSVADTLLLSPERMNLLATKRLTDTSMTLLKFIRENNAYTAMTGQPLTIRGVLGLTTAGAGSTQRMVAYRRSPEVLKLHYPMPHRFLAVWQSGPLRWDVPGVMRLGGLDIRRPKEVAYVDGI